MPPKTPVFEGIFYFLNLQLFNLIIRLYQLKPVYLLQQIVNPLIVHY